MVWVIENGKDGKMIQTWTSRNVGMAMKDIFARARKKYMLAPRVVFCRVPDVYYLK